MVHQWSYIRNNRKPDGRGAAFKPYTAVTLHIPSTYITYLGGTPSVVYKAEPQLLLSTWRKKWTPTWNPSGAVNEQRHKQDRQATQAIRNVRWYIYIRQFPKQSDTCQTINIRSILTIQVYMWRNTQGDSFLVHTGRLGSVDRISTLAPDHELY